MGVLLVHWKMQKVIISLMGWESGYHQCCHDSKGGHLTGVKAPFEVVFLWFLFIITLLSLQRRAADRSTSPLHQLSHCATRKPLSLSVIYNLQNFTMSFWLSDYSRWEVQCISKRVIGKNLNKLNSPHFPVCSASTYGRKC